MNGKTQVDCRYKEPGSPANLYNPPVNIIAALQSVFLSAIFLIAFIQPVLADNFGGGGGPPPPPPPPPPPCNSCPCPGGGGGPPPTTGKPVNLVTGQEVYDQLDLEVKGLIPIKIERKYDSQSRYDSTVGYGWSFLHDRRLYQYPDGSATIRYFCGYRDHFVYTGGAYVSPTDGLAGSLVENPDGSFVYTYTKDGMKDFYNAMGNLVAMQDTSGNRLELSYDARGKLPMLGTSPYSLDPSQPMVVAYNYRLTKIEERAADGLLTGKFVDFAYDENTGRLVSVTTNDGRTVTYHHDVINTDQTTGNLIGVDRLDGLKAVYKYEDPNDSHNLTWIQEGEATEPYVNTYDTRDRVVTQAHGNDTLTFNYITELLHTQVTQTILDENGLNPVVVVKDYEFDVNGNVTKLVDGLSNEFRQTYYANGQLQREEVWEKQGPSLVLIKAVDLTWNSNYQKLTEAITLASGEVITKSWSYDQHAMTSEQVVSSLEPGKIFRTEFTYYYDLEGMPANLKEIKHLRDDASFAITSYTYNANGKITSETLPDGHKQIYVYNPGSQYVNKIYHEVAAAESPFGVRRFEYDSLGNIIKKWDAKNNLTQYDFDSIGRLINSTDALLNNINYNYNTSGTIKDVTRDGVFIGLEYDVERNIVAVRMKNAVDPATPSLLQTFTYDSKGRRLRMTDSLGNDTSYTYNSNDRLLTETDPSGNVTQYEYDANGNRTRMLDALNRETRYTYDALDRLIKIEQFGITPTAVTNFTYDARGNRTSVTDPNGSTTTYVYDRLSHLIEEHKPLGQIHKYAYDDRDRIKTKVNSRGQKQVYAYFEWGPLQAIDYYPTETSQTPTSTRSFIYDLAGNLESVSDSAIIGTPLYNFTYDALNRRKTTTVNYLPGGPKTFTSTYTGLRRTELTEGSNSYFNHTAWDKGQLTASTLFGSHVVGQSYDSNLRPDIFTGANTTISDRNYYNHGIVQSIDLANSSGPLRNLTYTYDAELNVETFTDSDGLHDYNYDGLDRLTQALYPAPLGLPNENYTYDNVGNREDTVDPDLYDYDANHRMIGSPGVTYIYDNDGNTVSRTEGGITETFGYNDDNRLASYSKVATDASYVYDPMGRRIKKTINGTTIWYLWDDSKLIAEYDNSGLVLKRYSYLPKSYSPAMMTDTTGSYTVHTDHLDTPKYLTDSTGQIVWQSIRAVFGATTVNEDVDGDGQAVSFNIRFPGQYYDTESGLHYNFFRYYDASIGRYISSDPIGLNGGINTYAYGLSNPLKYTDSLGLDVYVCGRPADLPFPLGLMNHEWLLTDTIEAGMGAAGGGVPAQNGNSDWPGTPVEVVDHTDQSVQDNAHCDHVENVDEDCVNKLLKTGRPLGNFGPTNNCQSFVMEVLIQCDKK